MDKIDPKITVIIYKDGASLWLSDHKKINIIYPTILHSKIKNFFNRLQKEKENICNLEILHSPEMFVSIIAPDSILNFEDFCKFYSEIR